MDQPSTSGRLAGLAWPSLGGAIAVAFIFMAVPTLTDRPFRDLWPAYLALALEGACFLGGLLGLVGGIVARRIGAGLAALLTLVVALGSSAYLVMALAYAGMRC